MEPKNLLILMSDQHSRKVAGCYGNPLIRTPNIDSLARKGTLFLNAYTPSPVCMSARAAMATGLYAHQLRAWDNAHPYRGLQRSWTHDLRDAGIRADSIGKLHYRNAEDDTGFNRQIIPLHAHKGIGDLLGSVKDPMPVRRKQGQLYKRIGPGESTYTAYDRQITDEACKWLSSADLRKATRPWVLFVSYVAPHPPWFAPEEFYSMYAEASLPRPKRTPADSHPWLASRRESVPIEENLTDETRMIALRSYYALTTFMDSNIGKVLECLRGNGLEAGTRIMYFSDHGEDLGARGLWGKGTMYEEACGIPLILAGPDVPAGRTCRTPASLIDLYATVLDSVGLPVPSRDAPMSGESLCGIARSGDDAERPLFSEYHGNGATSGTFGYRRGHYKYIHYVGFEPQLFDLPSDPEEFLDLAASPEHRPTVSRLAGELRNFIDPEKIDAAAKADQRALIESHGGRERVVNRGHYGWSPVPGETPQFES